VREGLPKIVTVHGHCEGIRWEQLLIEVIGWREELVKYVLQCFQVVCECVLFLFKHGLNINKLAQGSTQAQHDLVDLVSRLTWASKVCYHGPNERPSVPAQAHPIYTLYI
jgi:hypothetical protein